MSGSQGKWKEIGSVLKKKDKENEFYIKIKESVSLRKDTALQLQDPRAQVDRLVELGHLTEEEGEERKGRIPDFVKFNIVLPPPRD